ncbi:TPA: hypothetical protein N0F65_012530 [Lagenidium giganteum]|uniref:Valine--tRNA ligase, mitochondrial n=1 Tax=Lagenidium giganteum TaxID=4803 RepID=A0AAV2YLT7_9STRA|nr:TPA: hypothetical protein N0F65_012530 [Lagenidium giganteum]
MHARKPSPSPLPSPPPAPAPFPKRSTQSMPAMHVAPGKSTHRNGDHPHPHPLPRAVSLDQSHHLQAKSGGGARVNTSPPMSLTNRPMHSLCKSKKRSKTSPTLVPRKAKENEKPQNMQAPIPVKNKGLERKVHSFSDAMTSTGEMVTDLEAVDVFLGGSCNPTTWRKDTAMPLLDAANVHYFNPQVDEWYEELIQIETHAKETAKIVLMVIDNLTRSIVCINESVEYICRGRRVVLVVDDIIPGTMVEGAELSSSEIADLNGARECLRALALKKKVRVYDNVAAAIKGTIGWLVEDNLTVLAPAVPRLRKRSSIILNEWSGHVRPRRNTSRSCSSSSILSLISAGSDSDNEDTENSSGSPSQEFVKHGGVNGHGYQSGSVYLGGNLQATWREHVAIPMLQQAGIPFFIPFQDYLSFELQRLAGAAPVSNKHDRWREIENEKADAELILFVIPSSSRSIAAMTEAVELVCSRFAMLLVIEPLQEGCKVEDDSHIHGREYKDLARARAYLQEMAERNDIEVFSSVRCAVESIVERLDRTTRRSRRPRVRHFVHITLLVATTRLFLVVARRAFSSFVACPSITVFGSGTVLRVQLITASTDFKGDRKAEMETTTTTPPPAPAAATDMQPQAGEQKMSKNAMKKAMRANKGEPKKEKDPNRWAPKKDKEGKKKDAKAAAPVEVFVNKTPKGEKKDMKEAMAAAYNPVAVESAWQAWWEKEGFFSCTDEQIRNAKKDERFVMVIPPPNVTGSLHLGHALTVAIQDALTRWHRMLGHATLWVPGTDHAGIATQAVVEKRLLKEEGKSRHDLGREKFLERVWDWKNQYETRIHHQFRSVGCSVDWTRSYFSMDDNCSRAVRHAFCKLWEEGLIYRATKMINWSCKLKTALSEIEVDYIDIEKRTKMAVPGHNPDRKYEFGVITSFGYVVEGSDEQLIVATTRLETMLGDTGVAIHPEDPRYKHLHGKFVIHPFNGRRIPIVLDAELVDMNFGTGAVKLTPAHDPNDYECGKRHGLEFINVLTDDGAINENGGQFAGMMRYDARIEVEKALAAKGLYHGKEDNKMRLGLCSRSGDVVEPLVKPQWFVDCNQMAKDAMDAVTKKDLRILPETHEKTWFRWLENIRDWCISRQLWWGHRIPAYFARVEGEAWVDPNSDDSTSRWFAGVSEDDARAKAAAKLGVDPAKITLEQDEDVLDTWVSAGLFPFAVFGWPEQTPDMENFYPTDLLETGYDILFFWVARMVFMGQKLTGKLPFHTVYLHSMVRDKYGRKMSKSLGNVVDPLEIISGCTLEQLFAKLESGNLPPKEVEKAKKGQQMDFPNGIPECGADALRFGLLAYTQQGRDINLDVNRLVGYRNFCNKLWNAIRFAMSNLEGFTGDDAVASTVLSNKVVNFRDRFILSRLNETIAQCNTSFAAYEFGELTNALYNFWLYDLCDVYLELTKPVMSGDDAEAKLTAQQTLYICLEYGLRLLHPLMPFVTEELWQRLPGKRSVASITIASYPQPVEGWTNADVESRMATIKEVIHAGRSIRAEYGLANNVRPSFFIKCADDEVKEIVSAQIDDFNTLAKAGETKCLVSEEPPKGCAMHSVNDKIQIHVLLAGLVDFANEISKLEKKLTKIQPSIDSLNNKMSKEAYTTKVPESVRETEAAKLEALTKEKEGIQSAIAGFQKLLD